jgi:hypothetical protein
LADQSRGALRCGIAERCLAAQSSAHQAQFRSKDFFGGNLRLRQKKEISQDRLSKEANDPVNPVVKIETGANPNRTVETLEKNSQSSRCADG